MGCPCILKSGARKGESCGRPALDRDRFGLFCRYHYKKSVQSRIAGAVLLGGETLDWCETIDSVVVECVVCLAATKLADLVVCVPCGHTCICQNCSQTIADSCTCPICDSETTQFLSLYFSGIQATDEDSGELGELEIRETTGLLSNAVTSRQTTFGERFRSVIEKVACCK